MTARAATVFAVFAAVCAAVACASSQRADNAVMASQLGWIRTGAAAPTDLITLTICINHRPFDLALPPLSSPRPHTLILHIPIPIPAPAASPAPACTRSSRA